MVKRTLFGSSVRRLVTLLALGAVGYAAYSGYQRSDSLTVETDPLAAQKGEELARNGRDGIAACSSCHGENGEGNFELGYPRLAGLHPRYIAKQLHDFARDQMDIGVKVDPIARNYTKTPRIYKDLTIYSPGIRRDPMMNPVARALSEEDIFNLSNYYASLPFTAKPEAVDFETLERGHDLALRGKPEYMMPRCNACHGPDGEGFGEHFPPLAGQPPQYLIKQISKWQNGDRDNDQLSMMKNTANLLTDGDKINAARYYSNKSYQVNVE